MSEPQRIVPPGPPDRRAETTLVALLGLVALCAVGFIAVYALNDVPHRTQYLGLALGLAFLALAAAFTVIAKRLVTTETIAEDYPPNEHVASEGEIAQLVEESGERFTRRRLVSLAGAGAAGALGAALIVPVTALGPVFDLGAFAATPWHRGRRLVDGNGRPLLAGVIEERTFYSAFPEGADPDQLAAPIVVVRLPVSALHLPADRAAWAPQGILAYSKICTHAGCAIALYRAPSFPAAEPSPALVCPCHYSTFDPATGGTVLFGPAGRPLPQLPLEIGRDGELRAGGTFSGLVGPSWWGVRSRRPR